jgi:hypothetical protein
MLIPVSKKGLGKFSLDDCLIDVGEFLRRVDSTDLHEINLEGATAWKDQLVLGNRGNLKNQKNHLIITNSDFWKKQHEAPIQIKNMIMPENLSRLGLGLSELCYVKERDILFFTLTSESTANAYDDGVIGDSFIGMIRDATVKLRADEVHLENIVNLTEVDRKFKDQKIEGVCAEKVGDKIILHLL